MHARPIIGEAPLMTQIVVILSRERERITPIPTIALRQLSSVPSIASFIPYGRTLNSREQSSDAFSFYECREWTQLSHLISRGTAIL